MRTRVIDVPRGMGKTNYLLKRSVATGYPIVVCSNAALMNLKQMAEEQHLTIPTPMVYNNYRLHSSGLKDGEHPEKVLVDDALNILHQLLGFPIDAITMSSNVEDDKHIEGLLSRNVKDINW